MLTVLERNINDAFQTGLTYFRHYLRDEALREVRIRDQRRLELREPFATTYQRPNERVLFDAHRDANPFFQLMEALWIICGRKDVAWLAQWLPSIAGYSDDGEVFHGAYGARIYRYGQLNEVIHRLQQDPDTTRAVLAIYDNELDADYTGKDMPCNCTVFLSLREGKLDLTVCNRSNDLIWGAYGTNVVQFSLLQEYIAAHLGVHLGKYTQFSNNTHIYPDNPATQRSLSGPPVYLDPYSEKAAAEFYGGYWGEKEPFSTLPLVEGRARDWFKELTAFINGLACSFQQPFFNGVAIPMQKAHGWYRQKKYQRALEAAREIQATDWRVACLSWIARRMEKAL